MAAYDNWRFEVSSADPDAAVPVWVDLTSRVRTTGAGTRPVAIRRGTGSERDDVQPSTLTALLDNQDHALTPDNTTSPYASWWGQRRRCQLVETVLGVDYVRFTGYTQPLDLPDWADVGVEQLVTLTAVDWLGRLDSAPAYTSTLGEHVRTQGGTLVEWFPLWDQTPETATSYLTEQIATRYAQGWANTPIPAEPDELIQAGLAGPPGDDATYLRWTPVGDAGGLSQFADAYLSAPVSITAGLTDTIALSAWVQMQDYNMAAGSVEPQGYTVRLQAQSPIVLLAIGKDFVSGSTFYSGASVYHPALGTTANLNVGRPYERYTWRLVTVRFTLSTGLLEIYSGADAATSTTVTAATAPMVFDTLNMGFGWSGGIAHVQVRVGPAASTMTRDMHLEQYAHGYRGLERQTVVERVTTVAGYAGVPPADLALDDAAATPMQRARLARIRPATVMRSAATTEGGRLFVTRDGQFTLRPRAARYNQPVALQIPYSWLSRGLRLREDTAINDVTVSQSGGSSTRRTDATSISRYGVGSDSVSLETAVDADLSNRAAWTVAAYKTPRVRCPQLVVDLLRRTDAERAQLLALDIGDRIEVTGGPATIPPAARHLIVEGFAPDEIGVERRVLTLNTSPVLGPSAGVPPACPVVGADPSAGVNPNAGFEDGSVAGWSADSATIAPSSARAYQGSWSMRITPLGGVATIGARTTNLPVTGSVWYLMSGWVNVPAGWSDVSVAVDWRDSGGAAISSSFGAGTAAPAGAWVYLSRVAQAPATAAYAQLRVRASGTPPASVEVWADAFDLAPATLVGPSTVVAY